MKRGYFLLLTLCAGIAACSGCAKKSQEPERKEVRQEKGKEEEKTVKTDDPKNKDDGTVPENHASEGDGKKSGEQGSVLDYLNSVIQEKNILLMESVAENTLLVVTEEKVGAEARFIDISERKILSVTRKMIRGIGYECQSYKNHFILQVRKKGNMGFYPIYYVFDHRCQMTDTIDIKKRRGDDADRYDAECILPSKKKIVYEQEILGNEKYYQLRLGGYSLKKGKKIYQVNGNKTNCTQGMEEMVAGVGEEVIFYRGNFYKDINEQARNCYGCFDLKSGKMTMRHEAKTEREYSKGMLVAGDEAYFYDGGIVEEENYTGKVYCMDSSGKTNVWKLKNKREGECVIVSDGGKYLATYYLDNENEKEDSYKTVVHIYDRKTKKEMAEKVLKVYAEHLNIFDNGMILARYSEDMKTLLMEASWKAD